MGPGVDVLCSGSGLLGLLLRAALCLREPHWHQDGAAQVKRTDVMRFHVSPAPRDALPFTAFRATIGRRNTVTTQRTLYTHTISPT